MLLSTNPDQDLLSRLYPAAAAGSDPLLSNTCQTSRYVLVEVPTGYERGSQRLGPGTGQELS